ncbi:MAG: exodeoxyribonuclease VII large subunit [Rhodocyclaceae bacterium]|nr:exodeoxyribonuclease VII large subunit [Rhodocyclaceae bacterium]
MPTFLDVQFKDKDQAKALGARWDAAAKKWYVPDGMELAPFNVWLPVALRGATPAPANNTALTPAVESGTDVEPAKKGMTLSQLLAGVAQAVAQAFKSGVWTMVEVVEARTKNGHVYLELSERTPDGSVLATARATLWATTANKILPEFERATGATIAPGIKLLVRAKPVFKPQYGFSIEIDAIDPEYTLGDLEARKREIRTRLQQEGIYDANKKLPSPWDFNAVLVVAPQGAAGLGDFQAEATRLERFGICRFVYATSRFQGEGAANEIKAALQSALEHWRDSAMPPPDAVVIIRGGGAVNDLAWLNDYELAKLICTMNIPVLTGIGHERDNTILDEVSNIRFDTPSKVAAGIEQVIKRRVEEAKASFAQLTNFVTRAVNNANARLDRDFTAIQAGAIRQLATAKQHTQALMSEVRHETHQQLSEAKREVPALFSEIRVEASNVVKTARTLTATRQDAIRDRASVDLLRSRESLRQEFGDLVISARRAIADAKQASQALVLEVTGQGPQKTLGRGFAIVRDGQGQPITSAAGAKPGAGMEIEFRDGRLAAQAR